MPALTDSEILRIAKQAVPEHIRPLGRVVAREGEAAPAPKGVVGAARQARAKAPRRDPLMAQIAKRVGATLRAPRAGTAVVEFPEQTALGLRTTVVHVRDGKVARVMKRG